MGPLLRAEGGTPNAGDIADVLDSHGECTIQVSPLHTQHLVDIHWAAHRAGELLGIKVRVRVKAPTSTIDPIVTIKVSPRRHDFLRTSQH